MKSNINNSLNTVSNQSNTQNSNLDTTEQIQARIAQLQTELEMPMPQKPEDESNSAEMLEYRKQLVQRHLREKLAKRTNGLYSNGNFLNLMEIMSTIVGPQFRSLYMQVESQLKGSGAQVEPTLAGVKEEAFQAMIDIIASSDASIYEQTGKERFINQDSQHLNKYVAEDITISNEIYNLRMRLRNMISN